MIDIIIKSLIIFIAFWICYSYMPKLIKRLKIKDSLKKEIKGYPPPIDINPPNSPEK
jgi:hypothetical protein